MMSIHDIWAAAARSQNVKGCCQQNGPTMSVYSESSMRDCLYVSLYIMQKYGLDTRYL